MWRLWGFFPVAHPPAIGFDYSASTLTRTFRIGKKQNYFCAFIGVRTRVARIVFEIGFLLSWWPRWDRESNHLPSSCDTRARELRIHEKTSTLIRVSSWIFLFFLFFPLSLRTRANVLYAAHSTVIRHKDFSAERSLLPVLLLHPSVRKLACKRRVADGKDRKGKRGLRSMYTHVGAIVEQMKSARSNL